jgi:hypothetical protein
MNISLLDLDGLLPGTMLTHDREHLTIQVLSDGTTIMIDKSDEEVVFHIQVDYKEFFARIHKSNYTQFPRVVFHAENKKPFLYVGVTIPFEEWSEE